jgi:hypothetical protein
MFRKFSKYNDDDNVNDDNDNIDLEVFSSFNPEDNETQRNSGSSENTSDLILKRNKEIHNNNNVVSSIETTRVVNKIELLDQDNTNMILRSDNNENATHLIVDKPVANELSAYDSDIFSFIDRPVERNVDLELLVKRKKNVFSTEYELILEKVFVLFYFILFYFVLFCFVLSDFFFYFVTFFFC